MTPPPQNPAHLLPVGAVLTGGGLGHSYRIGLYLGQGGFGVTYSAQDNQTRRQVAIKEYFPTRCAHRGPDGVVEPLSGQEAVYEGGRYSFVQEARMLAALDGMPSVVQGLDYLEINNTAYLVMEYLDGTPLYRLVKEWGRITASELLPRLYPLVRDMGRLHAAGVIHRDVSPDNVMWMKDGALKLLDFGCARAMEDGKSMTVALKQGFAPVEQYRTHGQGPWTDVYALCATVYYCLTGKIPPAAPDRLMEDTMAAPNTLGAGLAAEEQDALLWGLTVDPKQRPAGMELLAQRLFPRQWAADHPEPEPVPPPEPEPTPEPPTPPQPERSMPSAAPKAGFTLANLDRRVLIGIGAAALVLILILAFALGRGTAAQPSPTRPPASQTAAIPTFNITLPPVSTPPPTQAPAGEADPFPLGMKIGADGTDELLELYTAEDGAIYGLTDWNAVLLRVPAGVDSFTVPLAVGPNDDYVDWIEDGALDGAQPGISIDLGVVTCFDFSLYEQAQWSAWEGGYARSWILTCRAAHEINAMRDSSLPAIQPSQRIMFAADDRAEELTELYDGKTRPDGSTNIFAPLDSWYSGYRMAVAYWGGEFASLSQAETGIMADLPGELVPADEDTGEYWDSLGLSVVDGDDGKFYFWCYATY